MLFKFNIKLLAWACNKALQEELEECKFMMHTFNVSPEIIKRIREGKKRNALRSYYVKAEGKYIGLVNSETDKIDLVIKVGHVLDLTILTPEEKEIIMQEENISEELRPYFAPNFLYTIDSFETIQ